jgi:peptidoglycan/LPS O-acetylase OafA/YrhL
VSDHGTGARGPARLDSLTGLRFFAALGVFFWHCQFFFLDNARLVHVVRPGPLGVAFFFVLSGFVLTWSHREGTTAGAFYRRRAARIVPNHLVAVALAVLLAVVAEEATTNRTALALQVPMLQAWSHAERLIFGINGVDWTLSCELLFYACFPLLLPLVRRYRLSLVVAACLAAGLLVDLVALATRPEGRPANGLPGHDYYAYVFPPVRMLEFVLGMAVAEALRRGLLPRLPLLPTIAVAGGLVLLVGLGAPTPNDTAALVMLPMAALIVAAAQADLAGRRTPLNGRVLVVLGEWSFAFYLIHTLVLRLLYSQDVPTAPTVVGGLLLSVLAAGLLHRVVERPAEKRLRGTTAPDRGAVPGDSLIS